MPQTDAERLTRGFHDDVSRAPYRIAPERAQELNKLLKPLTLVFSDGEANCYAQRKNSEIGVTFAALLSLWAATRAALHIGNEAMAATRSGRAQLAIQPGTPIAEAYGLINAAKNLIRDPRAEWPNILPKPNALAVEQSPDWFANNLFLGAAGWTLLHEVAHIKLNHQEITTSLLRQKQEHGADEWATNWIFERVGQELKREFRIFATSTGIVWIGLIDTIRRSSTTHPHASERFSKCAERFGANSTSPGLELAAHITKAFFDPYTPIPQLETSKDYLNEMLLRYSRLARAIGNGDERREAAATTSPRGVDDARAR